MLAKASPILAACYTQVLYLMISCRPRLKHGHFITIIILTFSLCATTEQRGRRLIIHSLHLKEILYHTNMLLKLMILEALVAASSVRASETTPSPVMDAKSRHTPLAACPGRSKVYEALRSYSAPASFCSSFLSLTSGTSTATAPSTSVPVVGGSAE